ncbi:undecaprenyl-phosphate galactose phosphotransferase WbaP [Skermanella stibiiresistens]|uniref:undecaprenyl-phosphate galactose phosphotransferase WbaP n=1 Tax=Skermanella stibiiresistens TaxID=913326 RepID=UPI0018DC5884|nr:undecaprenyl-phosphate galactose phosphotransferase WbaP [Skermanella stibiiresistens]
MQPALFQFFVDVAAVFLAVLIAHIGIGLFSSAPTTFLFNPTLHAQELAVVLLIVPSMKAMVGLYPGYGMSPVERLRRQFMILIGTVVGVTVVDLEFNEAIWFSNGLLLSLLVLAVLIWISDALGRAILMRLRLWGRPCVIVGTGKAGIDIVRRLGQNEHLGYNPVLFIDENPNLWGTTVEGLPVVAPTVGTSTDERLVRYASVGILAVPRDQPERLNEMIGNLPFSTILVVPEWTGVQTVNTRIRDLSGMFSLEVRRPLGASVTPLVKRLFDIVTSALLLVLVTPLLLLIAIGIKLDSKGPLLFRQARWAGGSRSFPALKFRTMHADAELRLKELLATDPVLRREYEMYHKLTHDPRVTRFGRILRRLSFDELPQLWNVLIGDMSLIGPRPYMPHELIKYPHQQEVLARVRPGITGLWQVSGRHRTTFERRIELDVYYVENYSIWLDLHVLMRTVWIVVKADGA